MVRVKIYEPTLKRVKKKGERNTKTIIVEKEGKFLSERAVMNRTFDAFNDLDGEEQEQWIINHKRYFVRVDMSAEALEKRSKEELVDLAGKAGLKDAKKEDKKSLAQKVADFFSPKSEE